MKTKSITHDLVSARAERPHGWSPKFAESVREITLPGYTAFSSRDAHTAVSRLLRHGPVRVKNALESGGKGQALVASTEELDFFLQELPSEAIATYGLVLESDLRHVSTISVGHIVLDDMALTYHGIQRVAVDARGRTVYGGSDLVCVRGGWEALQQLLMPREVRSGVTKARLYDEAMREYPGFIASRRNYDIAQGTDTKGQRQSGVLEASWRAGGASPAELAALKAFSEQPELQIVEASHVEQFDLSCKAPPGAAIHFEGEDPEAGPILRYTVLLRREPPRRDL